MSLGNALHTNLDCIDAGKGGSFYVYDGQFVEDRFTMANYGAMSPGE